MFGGWGIIRDSKAIVGRVCPPGKIVINLGTGWDIGSPGNYHRGHGQILNIGIAGQGYSLCLGDIGASCKADYQGENHQAVEDSLYSVPF